MTSIVKEHENFDIAIPQVPITELRKPFIQKENHEKLKQAGTEF